MQNADPPMRDKCSGGSALSCVYGGLRSFGRTIPAAYLVRACRNLREGEARFLSISPIDRKRGLPL